jgi:hypothetical protein
LDPDTSSVITKGHVHVLPSFATHAKKSPLTPHPPEGDSAGAAVAAPFCSPLALLPVVEEWGPSLQQIYGLRRVLVESN